MLLVRLLLSRHSLWRKIRQVFLLGILGFAIYILMFSTRGKYSRRKFTSVNVESLPIFEILPSRLLRTANFDNTSSSLIDDSPGSCDLPEIIVDGLPWPDCVPKYHWVKSHSNETCYKDYGVNPEDDCSILNYLSTIERYCPTQGQQAHIQFPSYYEEERITPHYDFTNLYDELAKHKDVSWITHRISSMEAMWITSTKRIFKTQPVLYKKRIHIHLGLIATGMGKQAWKGGPLGELVQWSDIIASLYALGHDIVISTEAREILHLYESYKNLFSTSCTPPSVYEKRSIPFDLIYTDIHGYRTMLLAIDTNAMEMIRCRFRIVDVFGTEALFNHPPYRDRMGINPSHYNGLDLKLLQFNTMFPHTPDNTFMGFVAEFNRDKILSEDKTSTNKSIALVYGKSATYWRGKERYLSIVKEYVDEIHATVAETKDVPSYVVNHGIVDRATMAKLLRRSKIFVGLGSPIEGPGPLEAIQFGAVYLNPKYTDFVYKGKPTQRQITSQNPYVEQYIGEPYVYTVDIENEEELRKALDEITKADDLRGYLVHEFSTYGMLERLGIQIERHQFCTEVPYQSQVSRELWPPMALYTHIYIHIYIFIEGHGPPLTALRSVLSTDKLKSCNDVCKSAGLICEPNFFPVINRMEWFRKSNINFTCKDAVVSETQSTDYPALDESNNVCYLQNNPKLFSCANNILKYRRLCPCRDYIRGQVALCKSCGLT